MYNVSQRCGMKGKKDDSKMKKEYQERIINYFKEQVHQLNKIKTTEQKRK